LAQLFFFAYRVMQPMVALWSIARRAGSPLM
jgi:hypothetical protein